MLIRGFKCDKYILVSFGISVFKGNLSKKGNPIAGIIPILKYNLEYPKIKGCGIL